MSIGSQQAEVKKSAIANVLNNSIDGHYHNSAEVLSSLTSFFPNSNNNSNSNNGGSNFKSSKEMLSSSNGSDSEMSGNHQNINNNISNSNINNNNNNNNPPSPTTSSSSSSPSTPHSSSDNMNLNSSSSLNNTVSSMNSSNNSINLQQLQQLQGVQKQQLNQQQLNKHQSQPGYQTCSHINHELWWGTSPDLPISEFYTRSYKCKKCYIKQQTESKKSRTKEPNDQYNGNGGSGFNEIFNRNPNSSMLSSLANLSQMIHNTNNTNINNHINNNTNNTNNTNINSTNSLINNNNNSVMMEKKLSKYKKKQLEQQAMKQLHDHQDQIIQGVDQPMTDEERAIYANALKIKNNGNSSSSGSNYQFQENNNGSYLDILDSNVPDEKKIEIFHKVCSEFKPMIVKNSKLEQSEIIDDEYELTAAKASQDSQHYINLRLKGILGNDSISGFFTEIEIGGKLCRGLVFEDVDNNKNNKSNNNNSFTNNNNNLNNNSMPNLPIPLLAGEKDILTSSTNSNSENLQALLTLGKSDELKKRKIEDDLIIENRKKLNLVKPDSE